MKKLGVLLFILSLTIIFSACPPLLEDDVGGYGDVITFDEPFELDVYKWFEILDSIAENGKYVSLDLSNATLPVEPNPTGGLIIADVKDGVTTAHYVAFDPFPAAASGKNFILSIILPEEAQMVNQAVKDNEINDDEEEVENTKKYSAFRSFTNLRSVTGKNVTLIGNFAFADCTSLKIGDFPRVGHEVTDIELKDSTNSMAKGFRVDIGRYAFMGCTGLKDVKFNLAAVIGGNAFKGCTSLAKIDFPNVWIIEKNAFEGCKNLVNVFFEQASKISKEAFKDCEGLKKAEFNVMPIRTSSGSPITLSPAIVPDEDPVYDSVIFYPSVFSGCKALEVLNIRRAWNVYFAKNALAYTGTSIEIYLLDISSGSSSYGHPQNAMFLGDTATATTLKKVTIIVPSDGELIQENAGPENIAKWIRTKYPANMDVPVIRRN
jgi:hypothetical protein